MTEIIPGIYQLKIPIPNNPLGYTNVYLVKGDNKHLLIDTGWNSEEAFQSLKKQLAQAGVGFQDISQIVVTHCHNDHYGLVGRLKQLTRAEIALHYLEKNIISPEDNDTGKLNLQTDQWLHINGVPSNLLPPPMPGWRGSSLPLPDIILRGGETVSTTVFNLQVIWTPGHSPGHICLYEPTHKIFFSGDHILPVITPNISLSSPSANNPLGDFINSLNKVKQLDVKLVLPAHEHIFTDLPARVEEIIEHHEQRSLEILEAIKDKPKTAYEISGEIVWMPELGGARFQDLAIWDKRMAVSETLAHLEAMRVDGRVEKLPLNSIIYYQHT
ncbi:MAG: MBL fold metallo-hydrolase [Dehalococcoidales bacterium]|nr:MBL fold metallo-hydrolase [Dehalococcoidales bacterium]